MCMLPRLDFQCQVQLRNESWLHSVLSKKGRGSAAQGKQHKTCGTQMQSYGTHMQGNLLIYIYIHIVSNIPCGNQIWRAGKSSIHGLTPEEIQHVDWGLPNIENKHIKTVNMHPKGTGLDLWRWICKHILMYIIYIYIINVHCTITHIYIYII